MHVLISVDPFVKEFRVYCGEFCFISRKILVCLFFGLFFFSLQKLCVISAFLVFIATKMSRSDFCSLVSRSCEKKCIRLSFFFSYRKEIRIGRIMEVSHTSLRLQMKMSYL